MSSSHLNSGSKPITASTVIAQSSFRVKSSESLFSVTSEVLPGSLNDSAIVRAILVDAIRKCGKSREQIVDEMSLSTGTEITVRRLNGFTAESAEDYRFPAELDRAFCVATGDYRLLKCRAELAGFHLISDEEYDMMRLGREYLAQKRASEQVDLLEKRLAGVEL